MAKQKFELLAACKHWDNWSCGLWENNFDISDHQITSQKGAMPGNRLWWIDKAPEERGMGSPLLFHMWSMKPITGIMPMWTVEGMLTISKNMITGAAQMDGAILVVSAADGLCRRQGSILY